MEHLLKKCQFCQGPFKDPKVLPCFHILCRECIRSLQIRGVEELKCPVNMCTKKFTCREMDPESLPDASVVYHLQDVRRFKEKLEGKEVICNTCFLKDRKKKVSAVAHCDQCDYICQKCKLSHTKKSHEYSDHNTVSFLELSEQHDDILHMEVLRRSRSISFVQTTRNKCKIHPRNTNTSYCMDCKAYACAECVDQTHAKHRYRAASQAVIECAEVLQERVPPLKEAKNKVLDTVESVRRRKASVQDNQASLTSNVDSTFDRLGKILERRKEELKGKIKALGDQKVTNLAVQQLELERKASEMERMTFFLEKVLKSSTERELLTIFSFLDSVSTENMEFVANEATLQPVEAANISFKASAGRDLKDVCRQNLDVYLEQANPGSCSVEWGGLKSSCSTRQQAQFVVNVVDRNSRPCSTLQDVSVRVKCCRNDFESKANVHDLGMGRYRVLFHPEFRGRHAISVRVNGKAIPGSPFPLDVEMPILQLGVPQGCIQGVRQPRGIVISSPELESDFGLRSAAVMKIKEAEEEKILICEWNGNMIVEMDLIGRRSRTLGNEDILHPASLALSLAGDIFVVEGVGPNAGVKKWNRMGRLLKAVCGEGSSPGKFKSPRGMKISPSKEAIYICDRDNSRLQVFDLHLNFLRCIYPDACCLNSSSGSNFSCSGSSSGSCFEQKSKPNDLAFDEDENLYITDNANNCIHVLSPNDEYLSTFRNSAKGEPLAGPECIASNGKGYLYVTESQSHRVSVFQIPSGKCVHAFGSKGKGDGEFNFPMGIALDAASNVYVCELLNNRIQVF